MGGRLRGVVLVAVAALTIGAVVEPLRLSASSYVPYASQEQRPSLTFRSVTNLVEVDAIVTDLPTTIYLRDVEVEGSKLVGQFSAPGGDDWGAVLEKDSPLTACVTQAVDTLRESGELQRITDEWIGAEAPELQ